MTEVQRESGSSLFGPSGVSSAFLDILIWIGAGWGLPEAPETSERILLTRLRQGGQECECKHTYLKRLVCKEASETQAFCLCLQGGRQGFQGWKKVRQAEQGDLADLAQVGKDI